MSGKKPSIMYNGEQFEAFPTNSWAWQGSPFSSVLLNITQDISTVTSWEIRDK